MRFYDDALFTNFAQKLETDIKALNLSATTPDKREQVVALNNFIRNIVVTQESTSNESVDNFEYMFDILEFHAKEQKARGNSNPVLSVEIVDQLLSILHYRFDIYKHTMSFEKRMYHIIGQGTKLEYLLSPEQKHKHYNILADKFINYEDDLLTSLGPFFLLNKIFDNLEIQFCQQEKLAKLIGKIGSRLVETFETHYQNLVVKEQLIFAFRGTHQLDEGESLTDSIIEYRDTLLNYLKLVIGQLREVSADMGGINPKIYECYAKILILDEACQRFTEKHGRIREI